MKINWGLIDSRGIAVDSPITVRQGDSLWADAQRELADWQAFEKQETAAAFRKLAQRLK